MTTTPSSQTEKEFVILSNLGDAESYEAPDVLESEKLNPPASLPLSQYDHDYASGTDESQSPLANDISPVHDPSEAIGKWPRRLLHVPSMTSLEWQPGDKYGEHVQPRYNAISYTWGRFSLDVEEDKKEGEKEKGKRKMRESKKKKETKKMKKNRNITAVEIKGIDWAVPRINPEHFSADQFWGLIQQTCEPVDGAKQRTDFLWLDVACINQKDTIEKMAEIGRQAVIFHGAQRVYVWLTKVHRDWFSDAVRKLFESARAAMVYKKNKTSTSDTGDLDGWVASARASLDQIFIDPWFTSLWTLQEAFLCQHAYILPLEAELTNTGCESDIETSSFFTLQTLCDASTALNQVIESERPIVQAQWQSDRSNPDVCKRQKYLGDVYGMLNRRGLLALATRNPIALYNTAQYRRSSLDRDRVYGIQQVFGFRLGASAPHVSNSRAKSFNRFVLEDQLGAAILLKYPVASQLHVFTEPVEEGRGWRVAPSSNTPRLKIQRSIWDLTFEHLWHVSTEKIKGQTWGFFRGHSCGFSDLSRAWKLAQESPSIAEILGPQSPQQILLDTLLKDIADEDLKSRPEEPIWTTVWSKRKEIPRTEQQHRLASGVNELIPKVFEGESPTVLLLGSFEDGSQDAQTAEHSARYHVGLILVRIGRATYPYWKRLGFCIWRFGYGDQSTDNDRSPHLDLMRAKIPCAGWAPLSGLFG